MFTVPHVGLWYAQIMLDLGRSGMEKTLRSDLESPLAMVDRRIGWSRSSIQEYKQFPFLHIAGTVEVRTLASCWVPSWMHLDIFTQMFFFFFGGGVKLKVFFFHNLVGGVVGETNGHLDLHPLQNLSKAAPKQRLVWRELQQQVLEKLQVPPAKRPKLALKVLAPCLICRVVLPCRGNGSCNA